MNRDNVATVMRIAKAVRPFDVNAERARMDGALIAMMELREISAGSITLAEIGAVMQKLFHVRWAAKDVPVYYTRSKERAARPALSDQIEAIAARGNGNGKTHT